MTEDVYKKLLTDIYGPGKVCTNVDRLPDF